jgi:hypothetical protein
MTATRSDVLQQPLWVSALLASANRPADDSGLRHRVRWESGRAALRFRNDGRAPVFIPALGVELSAGAAVDVRWPAGATEYHVAHAT